MANLRGVTLQLSDDFGVVTRNIGCLADVGREVEQGAGLANVADLATNAVLPDFSRIWRVAISMGKLEFPSTRADGAKLVLKVERDELVHCLWS